MTDWIILRTAGSRTLALARSLVDAGFTAWTPIETREKRLGKKRELIEVEMPILPEYVFAASAHLNALLTASHTSGMIYRVWDGDLRRMVDRSYPQFSVFRPNGQIRPQTDRDLAALRKLEAELHVVAEKRREDGKRKGPAPRFEAGQIVRVDGGGFEGLRLRVVEANTGKVVRLAHPDWMWTVEICAWKLRDVQVSQAPPEQGIARAAQA